MRILLTSLLLATPVLAHAQALATNFQELRLKIQTGDAIYVTDSTGREFQAKVLEIAPPSLIVSAGNGERVLSERDVATIRQRLPDPVWQGALIGFGVGAGLGVLAGSFSEDCSHGRSGCIGGVLLMSGLGAGVGVGIDALIKGRKTIYSSRAPGGEPHLVILPVLTRNTRGAALGVRF